MVISKSGSQALRQLEAKLQPLLQELVSAPGGTRLERSSPIPEKAGLYLFLDDGVPFYVGQTRNLRRRLGDHCRQGGGHNSASLAFNMAKEAIRRSRSKVTWERSYRPLSRKQLEGNSVFRREFTRAKSRLSAMEVRVVECGDAELRTVLEVYVAVSLATPFNDFETH